MYCNLKLYQTVSWIRKRTIRFSDPRPRNKLNHWLVYPFFAGGVSEEIVGCETQDRRSGPRRLKCISDVHINSIPDPFKFSVQIFETRRGAKILRERGVLS